MAARDRSNTGRHANSGYPGNTAQHAHRAQGQLVTFRTSDSLRLTDQLDIPPETAFTVA